MATSSESEFTMMEHRAVGILYFIAGVVGIAGNLLLIVIFARCHPLSGSRGKLHISLAISNLMVVAGTPFSGSSAFAGRWQYGELGCKLYGLETYAGGMGAVTFAVLLCVQRYLYTKSPQTYESNSWTSWLLVIGWAYSIGIAVAPLLGWNSYVIESSGTACGLDWTKEDVSHRSFFVALPLFSVIQTIVAMVTIRGAFTAQRTEVANENDWFTARQLNFIAIANFAIVSIGFAPYGYFSIWALFNHNSRMSMTASVIPPIMAKLSTMFYPLVYVTASKQFQETFLAYTVGYCPTKKAK